MMKITSATPPVQRCTSLRPIDITGLNNIHFCIILLLDLYEDLQFVEFHCTVNWYKWMSSSYILYLQFLNCVKGCSCTLIYARVYR